MSSVGGGTHEDAPAIDACRERMIVQASTPISSRSSRSGIVASATTRLPRVSSMLMRECFLSVSMLPEARTRGGQGSCRESRCTPRAWPPHVLTGGVTGGVVEAQVAQRADRVLADVDQLADAGGGLGRSGDLGGMGVDPFAELTPPARARGRTPATAASDRRPRSCGRRRPRRATASRGCSWPPTCPRWWPSARRTRPGRVRR